MNEEQEKSYNSMLRDGEMTVGQLIYLLDMFPAETTVRINRNMMSFTVPERERLYFLGDDWREF